MSAADRRPRLAAVGSASWDRFLVVERYPAAGDYAVVRAEAAMPGGTTANSAVALARLGASVSLAAVIGADPAGAALLSALRAEGVGTRWLEARPGQFTDQATIVVSREPPERTIYWQVGARLGPGDALDLDGIYGHDAVLLDVDDVALRERIGAAPARTRRRTAVIGTLTYLVGEGTVREAALPLALRDDVLVGKEAEYRALLGAGAMPFDALTELVRRAVAGTPVRACAVSRGALGCCIVTPFARWELPAFAVDVVDTTGAGDAFAAGIAYGVARGWPWPRTGRFANAVGGLAIRALGAQAALPTLAEVAALTGEPLTALEPSEG